MSDLHGMWVPGNAPIPMRLNTRVRWVLDDNYETHFDAKAEIPYAELAEIHALERGNLIALGCLMETCCSECEQWKVIDSRWGIVIEPGEDAARDFFVEAGLGACFDSKETE